MRNHLAHDNLLLRTAFRAKRKRRAGELEHIVFEAGREFWRVGQPTPYALFPLRGMLSLQLTPPPAKQVEVAVVGREGFAGTSLLLGGRTLTTAVALTAGEAVAMPPDVFQEYLGSTMFRAATFRYLRSFVAMMAHISVCNRIHVIEKLCVGHLLMMQDRTQADSFHVTHDFFSRLLGVRRASVSRAAARLQKQGVIQYNRRGRLTILDRKQLEKSACSCYIAIKADFNELVASQGGF